MKESKQCYVAPSIEVVRLENEGVIAVSGEGYSPISTVETPSVTMPNSASSSDLEDMIDEIFTIQN